MGCDKRGNSIYAPDSLRRRTASSCPRIPARHRDGSVAGERSTPD